MQMRTVLIFLYREVFEIIEDKTRMPFNTSKPYSHWQQKTRSLNKQTKQIDGVDFHG